MILYGLPNNFQTTLAVAHTADTDTDLELVAGLGTQYPVPYLGLTYYGFLTLEQGANRAIIGIDVEDYTEPGATGAVVFHNVWMPEGDAVLFTAGATVSAYVCTNIIRRLDREVNYVSMSVPEVRSYLASITTIAAASTYSIPWKTTYGELDAFVSSDYSIVVNVSGGFIDMVKPNPGAPDYDTDLCILTKRFVFTRANSGIAWPGIKWGGTTITPSGSAPATDLIAVLEFKYFAGAYTCAWLATSI